MCARPVIAAERSNLRSATSLYHPKRRVEPASVRIRRVKADGRAERLTSTPNSDWRLS